MIKISKLTKHYSDFTALKDLSLEIKSGDIVGFLGPNGAGKTTTMRIMTGFLDASSGDVNFGDKSISKNEQAVKSNIGYMPENNPLYKDMLVCEFLEFTLELNNVPKDKWKKQLKFVVEAVAIQDKFYRPISELSKGYKQRVGLAAALINDPKTLILDEPTEGLDPIQRKEIRKLIKSLGKDRTVIISTHVMQEVEAMCNKIIIINKGEIVAYGSKDEILNNKDGSTTIKVTLEGKDVKHELAKIEGVKVTGTEKDGKRTSYVLSFKGAEKDLFTELSKKIAKNNWTIYSLNSSKQSLEEVFQNLTSEKK